MPASDQGILKGRYQLIPRVLVFATRGEQVLLLKGAPEKRLWANQYNGVGGHVERGESVLGAARREFEEETGLSLYDLWLCAVIAIDAGEPTGIGMYVFRAQASPGEIKASPEGALEWVPSADLADLPLVEDLPILLPRVLAMKAGDPPLFAHYSYDEKDKLIVNIEI